MLRDVSDIEVYKEALRLLDILYTFLRKIPRAEYDTVIQCKKCAKSVPSNIAEGWAKRAAEAEFKRFLMIALGSNDELISHLNQVSIILPRLSVEALSIAAEYKVLSKRINSLHKVWRSGSF